MQDTPLHLAALRKQTDIVRLLIEKQSDLTSRNTRRGQPLHAAAASGAADAVSALLDAGADIESEMANAERPLHLASFAGHDDVAIVLLDRGAEVDVRHVAVDYQLSYSAVDMSLCCNCCLYSHIGKRMAVLHSI